MGETRTALVIGAGGLGCPVLLGLAEAGIERLVMVDPDVVEASNLHRQVLFSQADVDRPKVEAASEHLAARIPDVEIHTERLRLTTDNALQLIADVNPAVVIDATDDPAARFAINDAALRLNIPAVLGGVIRFEGLVMAIRREAACFRCLFETAPEPDEVPTCASAGVLGAMAGIVGHLQVERALALLGETPETATGYITTVDGLGGRIRNVTVPSDPYCIGCQQTQLDDGEEKSTTSVRIRLPTSLRKFAGGNNTVQVVSDNVREALNQLELSHPGIKARLCDGDGNLRRFINIYANQEDIRFLDNLDTPLGDGAELQIVPAIAGGR